jgi:hypothetical protein
MHTPPRLTRMILLATLLVACGDDDVNTTRRPTPNVDMAADLMVEDMGGSEDMGELDEADLDDDMESSCRQGVLDEPDDQTQDTNCDGIDGDALASIFVATYGDDANPGTKIAPMKTVQAAIDAVAADDTKSWVIVEIGAYMGPVTLKEGVNIVGGYAFGWRRDTRGFSAIRGGNPSVEAVDITASTRVMNLELEPTRQIGPGESVFTMVLERSPGVVLNRMRLLGGVAGAGASGAQGMTGGAGEMGGRGGDGKEDSSFVGCKRNARATGGAGGMPICGGGQGGAGGQPGKENDGGDDGSPGDGGAQGGGGGPASGVGSEGKVGVVGTPGAAGAGAPAGGMLEGRVWISNAGDVGGVGNPGGGGGSSFCDSWGGAGGGGGSGGCGGAGGVGGAGGAASIALLLIESDVQVLNSRIVIGAGGQGGQGGEGGDGGAGGPGGGGGSKEDDSGAGGKGGQGGKGGRGGQGGGGAGGSAYGIYSDAALSVMPVMVEYVPGQGGQGGAGAGADGRGAAGETAELKIAGE